MNSIISDKSIETLVFEEKDYIIKHSNIDSNFDRLLITEWTKALDKNAFKYKVTKNSLPFKVLYGKYRMIAQLNEGRALLRRKPQDMSSIRQPFNDQKFNFTRISVEEVLFKLKSSDGSIEGTVIVNQSPIEFCNSLLVPQLEECKPQVLTTGALKLAISLVALSGKQSLKVGFNSLGAMASVNHLHFHLYYYDYEMVIDSLPIEEHMLKGWPIDTFVFEIKEICDKEIEEVVNRVQRVVDYCVKESVNIAHNLFISRTSGSTIRVFLWTREAIFGAKDDSVINPAFCEFTGFFMCKTESMFESIDETFCLKLLNSCETRCLEVKHLL